MAKRNTPKWREADYTPFFLLEETTHTEAEVRAEYSRLRDIAVKRAKRLESYGEKFKVQASFLKEHALPLKEVTSVEPRTVGLGKSARQFTSEEELRMRLGELKELLGERSYQLSGIQSLRRMYQDKTGKIIPLGQTLLFNDFMASWRTSAFSATVAASDAKAVFDEYQEYGGTFADFWTVYNLMKTEE